MAKKWMALWLGVAFIVVAAIIATVTGHTTRKVLVSEQMAQFAAELELPKMRAKGAQVKHLEIKFHDTADVFLEIEGSKLHKQYEMVVQALGQPDLARSKKSGEGELFVHATKIDIRDFHFVGNGPAPSAIVKKMSERYLIGHPGLQNLATDVAPHIEDWMKIAAEHAAILVLDHVPVYKFKTDTGSAWKNFLNWFAMAAVVDAKVVGNNLEITYSVWALTGAILLAVAIGIVCLLVFICLIALEA